MLMLSFPSPAFAKKHIGKRIVEGATRDALN